MARKPTKESVRDDRTIADYVMDWMAENCPSWTIDTLLTWPHKAISMGEWVCERRGRPLSEACVAEVCRVALNSRKRGKIRLTGGGNRAEKKR